MTRSHTAHPARGQTVRSAEVPVALPRVVMTVTDDGTMTVTVDGTPHLPPEFAPPWRREDFPAILDQITHHREHPVRVEVREADGATFTDIITAARSQPPAPDTEPEPEPEPERTVSPARPRGLPPELPVLHGDGFVLGEDVAVAVITAHTSAGPDGTARAVLSSKQMSASPTREVILYGRISGTITLHRLQ